MNSILFLQLLVSAVVPHVATTFQAFHLFMPRHPVSRRRIALYSQSGGNLGDKNDDGDESDVVEGEEKDWRDFRAKLVMQEKSSIEKQETSGDAEPSLASSTFPQQWAYESGPIIEAGSIILNKPKSGIGHGLRQQYFHKSAILVLSHEENVFTRAIILNRPSDMMLSDDNQRNAQDSQWRVWFGGEVQGMSSDDTEIVCLHTLSSTAADKVSTPIMKGIKYTTFEHAKELVEVDEASMSDFWLFAGYCGWGGGQLLEELARDSWIMITTDSRTVLKELKKRNSDIDPRTAGLDTWEMLMGLVGREHELTDSSNSFGDLMLKEWARQRLVFETTGSQKTLSFDGGKLSSILQPLGTDVDRATGGVPRIQPGVLLRGSSSTQSPFLLSDQDMHKCVVLVTSDDARFTTGVFLNHPTSKVVDLPVTVKGTNHTLPVPFIQKYGGKYETSGEGERPILWLHCSKTLRDGRVGVPFIPSEEGVWECTAEEVGNAIGTGMALPRDFMAVSGGCIWEKTGDGSAGGVRGEMWDGKFEPIPSQHTQEVWDALLSQELLSTTNIDKSIKISNSAWTIGQPDKEEVETASDEPIRESAGDTTVFNSSVRVSDLADAALRRWVATFVLNAPNLFVDELPELE